MRRRTAAQIKEEILQKVKEEWDVKGENYDPLVHLISGACANELERLYLEMDESENRTLEQLTRLFLPFWEAGAQGAHALGFVLPKAGRNALLPTDINWNLRKQSLSLVASQNLIFNFSPLLPTELINASITHLLTDAEVLQFDRTDFTSKNRRVESAKDKIWTDRLILMAELHKPVTTLENICIFLSASAISSEIEQRHGRLSQTAFFEIFASAEWRLNGRRIKPKRDGLIPDFPIGEGLKPLHQMELAIAEKYQPYFLAFPADTTLNQDVPPYLTLEWPTKMERDIDALINEMEGQPLIFEITLPTAIPLYADCFFSFNVFPVINRKLVRTKDPLYIRESGVHILPIVHDEPFLGIENIYEKGSPEKGFTFQPFSAFNKNEDRPTYTFRVSGVGHYDTYNFWERFGFLLTKIKAEYKNLDLAQMLGSYLSIEEFYQILNDGIETSIENKPYARPYILVQQGKEKNRIDLIAEFWTTQAGEANDIAAGTFMEGAIPEIDPESGLLMTSTREGRNELLRTEGVHKMRAHVNAQGRIATKADIFAFCKGWLEDRLSNVEVKEGTMVSELPGQGLVSTLDVYVECSTIPTRSVEVTALAMEKAINKMAATLVPIRIFISQTLVEPIR